MKNTFESFKKEALQRKKLIRTGESSAKEFIDWHWLYQHGGNIVELAKNL